MAHPYQHLTDPMSLNGILFILANSITGVSYLIISIFVLWRKLTLIPQAYLHLFAAFIFWCGVHHLVHATLPFGMPYAAQVIADSIMTTVSALTAILIAVEIFVRRHV